LQDTVACLFVFFLQNKYYTLKLITNSLQDLPSSHPSLKKKKRKQTPFLCIYTVFLIRLLIKPVYKSISRPIQGIPDSWIHEIFACGIWNLALSLTIETQNLTSTDQDWNTIPGIRNPLRIIQNPKLSWFPYLGRNCHETKAGISTVFTFSDHAYLSLREPNVPVARFLYLFRHFQIYSSGYFTLTATMQWMLALSWRTIFYSK